MRKILYAFICTLMAVTLCFANTIKSIDVVGNALCSKESIIKNSGINKGDRCTQDTLLSIRNKIFSSSISKFISDVEISLDQGKLHIVVKEKYLVNEVIFNGVPYSQQMILKNSNLLKSKKLALISDNELKEDLFQLKNFLLSSKGAATLFVDVIHRIEDAEDNKVNIIFYVNVGPKISIRSVKFIGNNSFDSNLLSDLLITRATRYSFMSIYAPVIFSYDEAAIQLDQNKLEKFYKHRGFLDVKVSPAFVNLNDNLKSFDVTFSIIEGNRYSIGKVEIVNEIASLPTGVLNKIRKKSLVIKDKNRFDCLEQIQNDIITKLFLKGYKDINVDFNFSDVVGYVKDITFKITNSKNYIVRNINITGNLKTKEDLIRGCLKIKEGNSYTSYDEDRSKNQLNNIGFFEDVIVSSKVSEDEKYIDLDIKVVERKTLQFNPIALHFALSDGFGLDSGLRDVNFLGKGIHLATNFSIPTGIGSTHIKNDLYQVGDKKLAFSFFMEHPYLFDYSGHFAPNIAFKYRRFYNRIPKEDLKEVMKSIQKKEAGQQKVLSEEFLIKLIKMNLDEDKTIKNLKKNLFFDTFRLNLGSKLNVTNHIFFETGIGAKVNTIGIKSKFSDLPRKDVTSALKQHSKLIGEEFNRLLPKAWLAWHYNNLNSNADPKNGFNLTAKVSYKDLFSNFSKYKLFSDFRYYHSFLNNFFTFATQLQAGYTDKLGSSNDLRPRHKFHSHIAGFDSTGMEPFLYKRGEDKKLSREGTGGKFFWKLQNELRMPLGPQRLGLSGFAFFALGDVFNRFATDAEKARDEEKLKHIKESSEKGEVGIDFYRKIRGSIGIGLRFPFQSLGSTLRLEVALFTFGKNKHDVLESFKISAENSF